MFRSKRNSLVKRLWKYKINDETRSSSQKETSRSSSPSTPTSTTQEDLELKTATHSFFKKLKEEQLQILLQAMESRGGEITPCVPVAKSDIRFGKHTLSPYNLCCRVFRWPDLKSDAVMKRLPNCTFQNDEKDTVICCNPYHWSLVVKIDEPPIYPDKLLNSSSHCPKIENQHEMFQGNTEEQNSEHNHMYWCTLAYWELRERVGRLFQVTEPSVHVFQQLPHGNGVCLRLFQKPTCDEAVRRTREKIGFGIILSREAADRNGMNVLRTKKGASLGDSLTGPASQCTLSQETQVSPPHSNCSSGCGINNNNFSSTSNSVNTSLCLGGRVDDPSVKNGCECGGCTGPSVFPAEDSHCCVALSRSCDNVQCDLVESVYDETMDYSQTILLDPPSSPPPASLSDLHPPHPYTSSPSSFSSFSSSSSPPSSPPAYHLRDGTPPFTSDSLCSRHLLSASSSDAHHHSVSCIFKQSNKNNNSNKRAFPVEAESNTKMTRSLPSKHLGTKSRHSQHPSSPPPTSPHSCLPTSPHSCTELPFKQGEVWAYNASDFPIFVNSPTLDSPDSPKSLVVKKVPPGHSIKIFDYARAELLEHTEARHKLRKDGPFDPCSIRISLAKGWGHNYSRQFITSCPCWLEVFLGVRRRNSSS
ncbi:hypothetical protein Btru_022588 [Bulinus truncatus]|nr:hypothetical protein Btru_022588 [Bulinus truncatus]